MDPRLAGATAIHAKNHELVAATLDGVDDALYRRITLPDTSPMAWILGHMVGSRYLSNRLLGGCETFEYADLFARSTSSADPDAMPSLEEMLGLWNGISGPLDERLNAASPDQLDRKSSGRVPSTDETILGTINFLALHESYHLGQLGFLRKAGGLPGLAG